MLLRHGISGYSLTTSHGGLPPEGAEFHARKAPGVLAARLNGGDTDKPKPGACWCPRTKPAAHFSPPATQYPTGGVEGIHEGRGLQQRQGKPVSIGWVGPFSGTSTHKADYANLFSKHPSPPSVESRLQQVRAKPIYPEALQYQSVRQVGTGVKLSALADAQWIR